MIPLYPQQIYDYTHLRKTMNATIQKNNRGGWSITPPNSKRAIGNYATPESASAVAKQNGWNPEVK